MVKRRVEAMGGLKRQLLFFFGAEHWTNWQTYGEDDCSVGGAKRLTVSRHRSP